MRSCSRPATVFFSSARQRAAVLDHDVEGDDAFDALDGVEIAVPGDVGGLRRPRRNGADARRDEEQFAGIAAGRLLFQQRRQLGALVGIQGALLRHDMPVIGHHRFDVRDGCRQGGCQALQTEGGKGGVALEAKNVGHWRGDFGLGREAGIIPEGGSPPGFGGRWHPNEEQRVKLSVRKFRVLQQGNR